VLAALAAAPLAACGGSRAAHAPEGALAFSAGGAVPAEDPPRVLAGPAFARPGLLVPAAEPVWQSAWLDRRQESRAVAGAAAGFRVGMSILLVAPAALVFWPAAVAVVGGTTVLGAAGALSEDDLSPQRMAPPDRQVIAQATGALQPHRVLREAAARALARRAGAALPPVPCGPGAEGERLAREARSRGLDGLVEFSLEAVGLAAGADRDTYGVFVQVRARAFDGRDGSLRYERVLSYGPGRPVEGLPRAEIYSIEMLAMDEARAYRHLATEAIRAVARRLAADPASPLQVQGAGAR